MFLLIPASVVAVATTLRGFAVLFGKDLQKRPAEAAVVGYPIVQPLVVIGLLAPMIGAVAAAWRVAAASFGAEIEAGEFNRTIFFAFVPLAWGVTVGFIAMLGYGLLRVRLLKLDLVAGLSETGKSRWPSVWPGFVVMMVGMALCAAAMLQLQTDVVPALPNITLAPPDAGGVPVAVSADTTVLEVNADSFRLNGQSVSESDLLFRLSALASKSPVIVIKAAKDELPAERLTEALLLVNQAGFTQIGIQ